VSNPPFFDVGKQPKPVADIAGARCLALLGDSLTTASHLAGGIDLEEVAGGALLVVEHGRQPEDFNSYGARRGNHEVMMRGTFANTGCAT